MSRFHSEAAARNFREALAAKWDDPEWAAVRRRQLAEASCPGVPVPKWVPDGLSGEYRDFARLYGQERAAKEIRAMKRAEEAA